MTARVELRAPAAFKAEAATCRAVFRRVLPLLGDTLELGVALVDRGEMADLNGRFRQQPNATDVLSFDGDTEGTWLGDVAVCVPVARDQARALGHPAGLELAVLCVHALVHLSGLDHERGEDEAQLQAEIEMGLLSVLGLPPEAALTRRGMSGSTTGPTARRRHPR